MPHVYRMRRPFLYLVEVTILQCWHLVVACSGISYLNTPEEFSQGSKSTQLLYWGFLPYRLLSLIVSYYSLTCITNFKLWLWSSCVNCLIHLYEVAKSCPVPKAVCPRRKSFCSSPALSPRRCPHAGLMQKDLLMQKWCTHFMLLLRRHSAWQTGPNADHTHNVCLFLWGWHPSHSCSGRAQYLTFYCAVHLKSISMETEGSRWVFNPKCLLLQPVLLSLWSL